MMYSGPQRADLWTFAGWVAFVVLVGLAAAGFVGLLMWDRTVFLLVVGVVCTNLATWRASTSALRAELEAVRERLSTYNASETHEALAEVGPVTPATGTVELFDGAQLAEWREQAGHPCEWFIGDADDECGDPADSFVTDSDGDPVWLCPTHLAWVPEPAGPDYSGWSRAVASPVDDDPADTLPRVLPEGRMD